MKRLVLIDGNAILHRAYHALPPLTDPDGIVVNAVYGFCTILMKIVSDLKPTHMAVAFDRAAPTFRKELYTEYQIKRPKMDDDLIPQIEKVHELVRSFDIPIFEMDGFEADDVIGTIVSNIKNKKSKTADEVIDQTIIVTGDRDILQLVEDDKVFVYMPTKGLSEAKLYGEKEVKDRMGVTPKQIPDFKALAGDSSDNYPGVAGIGPKTAVSLIEKTGSVDNLYQQLKKEVDLGISENIKNKLINGEKDAELFHTIATIKPDVPIEINLIPFSDLNNPKSRETIAKLGFKTILKRLTGEITEKKPKPEKEKKDDKKDDSEQLSLV
jgi:5'-3' exonuclease